MSASVNPSPHVTSAIGVLGAGARTALGRSLPASAAAVRARIATVGRHPFLRDRLGRSMKTARVTSLPAGIEGAARFAILAKNAAKEALAPLLREGSPFRVRVLVGLPEARPGRPLDLEDAVVRSLGKDAFWGEHVDGITHFAGGHAASNVALEAAAHLMKRGEANLCLVGGVDSYLDVETMEWLEETGRLRTASRLSGFIPGEGAGFCLLASARWLEKNKVEAPMTLVNAASASEPAGLSAALEGTLGPLRSAREVVSLVIGDLNGEPHRTGEIEHALTRVTDVIECAPADVLAPAEYWGDVGAASGALFAGLAFTAAARGYGRGQNTLICTSAEDGRRSAALFRSDPLNGEASD